MSGPGPGRDGQPRRLGSRPLRAVVLATVAVAVLVTAAGIWYIFFRPAGPAPVGSGAPLIPPGAVSSTPAPSLPAATSGPTMALPTTTP